METLNHQIGAVLRDLRKQRSWSLDRLAEATGVSKAMLGQIERGESSPTIATLWKIATGLEVSFTSLVGDLGTESEVLPTVIHRAGSQEAQLPHDQLGVEILFPYQPKLGFELMALSMPAGMEHLSEPHEVGVIEHVTVIEGCMQVLTEGKWVYLEAGDAIRFAADRPHGYRNRGDGMVLFHNLICYPGGKARVDDGGTVL